MSTANQSPPPKRSTVSGVLQNRIQVLESDKERLLRELGTANGHASVAKVRTETAELDIATLKQEREQWNNVRAQLTEERTAWERERVLWQEAKTNVKCQAENNAQAKVKSAAVETHQSWGKAIAKTLEGVQELREANDELWAEKTDIEQDLEILRQENGELQTALSQQRDAGASAGDRYRIELDKLRMEKEEAVQAVKAKEHANELLKAQVDRLRKQEGVMKQEAVRARKDLETQVLAQTHKLEQRVQERDSLQAELDAAQNKLKAASTSEAKLKSHLETLRQQHDAKSATIADFNIHSTVLIQQRDEAISTSHRLTTMSALLWQANRRVGTANSHLRMVLDGHKHMENATNAYFDRHQVEVAAFLQERHRGRRSVATSTPTGIVRDAGAAHDRSKIDQVPALDDVPPAPGRCAGSQQTDSPAVSGDVPPSGRESSSIDCSGWHSSLNAPQRECSEHAACDLLCPSRKALKRRIDNGNEGDVDRPSKRTSREDSACGHRWLEALKSEALKTRVPRYDDKVGRP